MQFRLTVRRGLVMTLVVLLAGLLAVRPQDSAANDHTYFPETGHYLGGGFRDFWNGNGGLKIFGYPLTEEYRAPNGRTTQWFERARFELAPDGRVELGLLGSEATIDRVFPQIPPRPNDANHRYFPETSHMIMWGFKTIWETKGGLPIFGLPISEEMQEILPADNKWHTVQYFERARFEYWPDFPDGQRVLISDLGRRLVPRELTAPLPPGSPPGSTPPPGSPNLPPNVNATVTPSSGPIGTVFSFNAFGFQPGETVALWATAPDQTVVPANFELVADPDGSLTSSQVTFTAIDGIPTGIWALTAQGKASGNPGIGYFLITGDQTPPPPVSLPPDKNARVEPREGPPGTRFNFFAGGFVPGENVAVAAFNSAGNQVSNALVGPADANGSIDYAGLYFQTTENTPPDIYQILALGDSGRDAYAYLRLYPRNQTVLAMRADGPTVLRAPVEFGTIGRTN